MLHRQRRQIPMGRLNHTEERRRRCRRRMIQTIPMGAPGPVKGTGSLSQHMASHRRDMVNRNPHTGLRLNKVRSSNSKPMVEAGMGQQDNRMEGNTAQPASIREVCLPNRLPSMWR